MDCTSPFSDRLNSNYCPSENEIAEIESLIAAKRTIVEDIDRQIEALVGRRARYSKFIKEHSALLSPLRRAPTDVLSSIFSACLPPPSSTKRYKIHPAIAISHVCQQWRHLAIAQPLLWCNFEVFHPILPRPRSAASSNSLTPAALAFYRSDLAIYSRQLERVKDMLLAWLSRSASCPLTFILKSQDIPSLTYHSLGPSPPSINEAIVDTLCGVSNRWKSASFDLWITTPTSPLLRFSQLSPKDVPQLERVRHKVDFSPDMNWDDSRILEQRMVGIGLLGGPSIRKLAIDRLSLSPDSMSVDWASVTDLELDDSRLMLARTGQAVQFITSVLRLCHRLTRFAVNITGRSRSRIILPLETRISLPYLTSVSIRGKSVPSGFASSLQLPSLHTLSLLCEVDERTEPGLVEWITTFGDALTDVTLMYTGLTESALNSCLEHLPNVITLRLLEHHRTGFWRSDPAALDTDLEFDPSSYISILQRLTPRVNDDECELQCYCPKLQKFGFRMQDLVFTEEELVEFVTARRNLPLPPSSRLKSVIVKFSFRQQLDLREELERRAVDMEDFDLITKYNKMDQFYMSSAGSSTFPHEEELDDLPVEDQIIVTDIWLLDTSLLP
ncbi:hypothetical protein H1R20_g6771, partial [Candolleomyces eurysporus]